MTGVKRFFVSYGGLKEHPMAKQRTEQEERIIKNLKFFRDELKLSQAKMAAAVGVPANTWSTWEQGLRVPGADKLFRIADALDRSVDEIGAESPTPSALPIPPALALTVVDKRVDPELEKKASAFLRELNRKHRQKLAKQRQTVDLESFDAETDAMEGQAPGQSQSPGKPSRGGKKR